MDLSRLLMIMGAALLAVGVVLHYAPWLLTWFGRLLGDIRIEKEHGLVFIPLTSMLVVSVIVSLLLNLIGRK